jgi:VanZ family protein
LIRWLALGLCYAAIVFTSSLAATPVTNQALSDLLIAKIGHVAVYGLLGWITVDALRARDAGLRLGRRSALLAATVVGVLLATLDEVRQSLVYGRTGVPADVLLDTIAVSGGALLHQWLAGRAGSLPLAETAGEPGDQRPVEDEHQKLHRENLAVAVDVRQEGHHDSQVDQDEQVEGKRAERPRGRQ